MGGKIFFLFLIYIIFISFFSFEVFQSLKSSISQIRFILFIFFLSIINFKNIFESLKNILILVILFVCIDVNIQFIFGYDIFGYAAEGYSVAKYPPLSHWKNDQVILGRLSGPFGTELIPGAFISSISPPVIFYIFNNLNKKNIKENIIKIFFIIFIIFSVLLTGERLAFILICFCFLYALFFKLNIKNFIIFISFTLIFIYFLSNIAGNNFIKKRWADAYNISKDVKSSSYGRIYTSAIIVWKENIYFGTGLKNYKHQCQKLKDPDPENIHSFCSPTHPHNIYFELLSETGIIGTLIYMIFYISMILYLIKNLKRKIKDKFYYFALGSFFYLIFKIIPLPSGSIFSTWNASLFWFHLGICMSYIYPKNLTKNYLQN